MSALNRLVRHVGSEVFILLVLAAFALGLTAVVSTDPAPSTAAASARVRSYPDPADFASTTPLISRSQEGDPERIRAVFQACGALPLAERRAYLDGVLADPTLHPNDAWRIRHADWLLQPPGPP